MTHARMHTHTHTHTHAQSFVQKTDNISITVKATVSGKDIHVYMYMCDGVMGGGCKVHVWRGQGGI